MTCLSHVKSQILYEIRDGGTELYRPMPHIKSQSVFYTASAKGLEVYASQLVLFSLYHCKNIAIRVLRY